MLYPRALALASVMWMIFLRMTHFILLNREVLHPIVNSLLWFSHHHVIFLFNWDVVNDMLDLVVVCAGSLDGYPLSLLHIIDVFLLVGNVLDSALGRGRVRTINVLLDLNHNFQLTLWYCAWGCC